MQINQRPATLEDAAQVLAWRNDPHARQFSMNSEMISNDLHLQWLSARLKKMPLEPFFIFEIEGRLVGMSRLDISPGINLKYEISILVDPAYQGKGIGAQILDMTCMSYARMNLSKAVVARVHKNNIASQNLFKRAGFNLVSSSGIFFEYEKT